MAGAVRAGPRRRSCTAPTTRCTCATATSTVGSAPTTPASRAWCSGSSAGTPTPSRSGRATSTRATCATCPARPARVPGSSRRSWRSPSAGSNIAEICAHVDRRVRTTSLDALELNDRQRMIAERVLKEINARLRFLVDVGLDYLSLDRAAGTLSGGEAQRIRLATQIGSGLVGVLYVLDEPSHRAAPARQPPADRDPGAAASDLGNTLIVVEHDEDTIRTADWVVDIGPGAGRARRPHRPQWIVRGPAGATSESITGAYLSGRRSIPTAGGPPAADPGPGAGRARRPRAQPART